jgi:hypothetical protein
MRPRKGSSGATVSSPGRQAQAALLVLLAGEVALLAQQAQVLVHRAVRGVAEAVADLAVRRRVAVTAVELGEEIEDGLLAFGERCAHGSKHRRKKGVSQ